MGIKIIWDGDASDFVRKLDRHIASRIVRKVKEIKLNPERYIFSLVNIGVLKIRIGDYRLFVNYYPSKKELVIRSIKHRKKAYKK